MQYKEALEIAERIRQMLNPHCVRCEIAGSIRRKKPEVKDIEIVIIPKPYETGLFANGIAPIVDQWQKVKGELGDQCKYTQRILPEGIKLDLFFAERNNFGNIFLIRTGDWEFSKKFMGVLLPRKGYSSKDGWVHYGDNPIATPEEINLFERAGIQYIEPENRNFNAI